MRTVTFELEGGFNVGGKLVKKVTLRELSGYEEDIWTDISVVEAVVDGKKQLVPARTHTQRVTEILARCTLRVGDVDYDNLDPDKADADKFTGWRTALSGDRVLAMMQLRVISLGEEYSFKPMCPHCGHELTTNVKVNLLELERKPFFDGDPDREAKLLSDVLKIELKSGNVVEWTLPRTDEEDKINSMQLSGMITSLLMLCVKRINGEEATERHVKRLTAEDRRTVRTEFEKAVGGLSRDVDVECQNTDCLKEFKYPVAVADPSFFFPSAT